jgi:hypothetical protein
MPFLWSKILTNSRSTNKFADGALSLAASKSITSEKTPEELNLNDVAGLFNTSAPVCKLRSSVFIHVRTTNEPRPDSRKIRVKTFNYQARVQTHIKNRFSTEFYYFHYMRMIPELVGRQKNTSALCKIRGAGETSKLLTT